MEGDPSPQSKSPTKQTQLHRELSKMLAEVGDSFDIRHLS